MIDGEVVTAIRTLTERGVGKKAFARELYETGGGQCGRDAAVAGGLRRDGQRAHRRATGCSPLAGAPPPFLTRSQESEAHSGRYSAR